MTAVSPLQGYTASLFGLPPKAAVAAVPPAPVVVVGPRGGADGSAPALGGSGGDESYKDPEFMRDPKAALAKAEAAFAAYEAREQRFAQENGYRRKVNEGALGSYAQAKSGIFGVPWFKDAIEAAAYAAHLVGSMASNASIIWFSDLEVQSLARPEVAAFYGEVTTGQLRAKHADSQKAAEMDLFVVSAVLSKAFNVTGPIYRQEGAKVSFVAQEFTYGGRAVARLDADGTLPQLGADGQPISIGRRS